MLAVHYWKFSSEPWTTALLYEFIVINVISFLQWLSTPFNFPYWIPIFFLTAIPATIVSLRYKYHEFRLWVYVCVTLVHLSLLSFYIWGMIFTTAFPWFLGVWIPAGGVIGYLWWSQSRQGDNYAVVTDDTISGVHHEASPSTVSFSYQNSDPNAFVPPQTFNDPSTTFVPPQSFSSNRDSYEQF